MDFENKMKYFSAVAYDGSTYNFGITPNGEISCAEFGITVPASIIELKPNFVLRKSDGGTIYSLDDYLRNKNKKKPNGLSLISKWIISEDIFEYLINNKKVMYSAQIATLYGFDNNFAFDIKHNKRVFKTSRNNAVTRARVLAPMKSGKFN